MDARHILTIGIAYEPVRGGVAAVENVYSTFYKPFNHIATVGSGDDNKAKKLLTFIKAYCKFLWWMLRHKEIKIVHVQASTGSSFWRKRFFINISKKFHKKIVFHCHGGHYPEFTVRHYKSVKETVEKCDCIIALSDWWRQWFENTFNITNVIIIKNVITEPHIHNIDHKGFVLLFLGLLGQNKGIYDLLDVLADNKNFFEGNIELLIGGNGETEKVKKIISDKDLTGIVKYEGWVSGIEKEYLLNMADAFILPSYHEGVPISILEAESYSLPIISTNVGGIPEIVKDGVNGFLVTPGDKPNILKAIERLSSDKALATRMGKKSYDIAKEHLPNFVEKRLDALYRELLRDS